MRQLGSEIRRRNGIRASLRGLWYGAGRWGDGIVGALAALVGGQAGGGDTAVTLARCDVGAAEEARAAAGCADALLHAGGVLRVGFCRT